MSDLPPHPVHKETGTDQFDVFIAGSGPIGATFARLLCDEGYKVVMVEIGDQESRLPGAHKKNEIVYQKDIDRFVRVIQGDLATVSVPPSTAIMPTLDPSAWRAGHANQMTILNGRNPHQQDFNNLAAEAVTRCVGGMSTHWTCSTPEFLPGLERPEIFPKEQAKDNGEWQKLYIAARALIGTSEHEFDHSIRHNTVLNTLKKAYPDRVVKSLPLACHRLQEGSPYVRWHAAENVFGDMFTNPDSQGPHGNKRGIFRLIPNTSCTQLITNSGSGSEVEIKLAQVKDLLADRLSGTAKQPQVDFVINAKSFVIASGAIGTPQLLSASGFGARRDQPLSEMLIPSLGKRITEQPMSFCQIVLRQNIVEDVGSLHDKPKWWQDAVKAHRKANPHDPLPIPVQDPEPQVTIPATLERPWHTQIHRDAFSYGEAGPRVDPRLVVDLRFFGRQSGEANNRIIFEPDVTDAYGMPQPTFEYLPSAEFANTASLMMNDMTDVANKLGGYLPDSEPQFMTPGLALHLGGSIRLGHDINGKESVANYNSQVWNFTNLWVGGNGTIPTAFGANPTLTSIALAIRAAYSIRQALKSKSSPLPVPTDKLDETPKSWVDWLIDPSHPSHPDHTALRSPHRSVTVRPPPRSTSSP